METIEESAVVTYYLVEPQDPSKEGWDAFELFRAETFKREQDADKGDKVTKKRFRSHADASIWYRLRQGWGGLMEIDMANDPNREETSQELDQLIQQMAVLAISTATE